MEKNILSAIEQLLNNREKGVEKDFLDTSETCIFLGVSKSTLYKLNYRKAIPCYRPNGSKKKLLS